MFELLNITEEDAYIGCTVRQKGRNDFKIQLAPVNANIIENTSGSWDNIVNWVAGILMILWLRESVGEIKMPKNLVVNNVEEWFKFYY